MTTLTLTNREAALVIANLGATLAMLSEQNWPDKDIAESAKKKCIEAYMVAPPDESQTATSKGLETTQSAALEE